jgi:uncharacterized protein (TIGR00730 family)
VTDGALPARTVAVFGSSEPQEGDALYEQARTVGRLLAKTGVVVLTGGYGGVMEGASRGACEAGGLAVGVVSSALFGTRDPNPFLSERHETQNLHERTQALIERADAYLVLHGKSGTLAELTLVWALIRAGSLTRRPVVLLGPAFSRLVALLAEEGMLDGKELRCTRIADDPEAAVRFVCEEA